MTRKLLPGPLIVASHNEGKVKEIRALLGPYGVEAVSAKEAGLDEPEETGTTFRENAELKALAAARASGLPALADDSGLCVDALDGSPGVYTANWAEKGPREGGPGRDWYMAMGKVEGRLQELGAGTPRSAHFVSTLTLAWPDGHVETVEGRASGQLVWPPRGRNGFGYDPMFLPDGHDRTFGEMAFDEKQPLTHRARAFEKLVEACLR